jgi:hypothetical protein
LDGRKIVFKGGWEPALGGKWMDWEEDHWGLSGREYRAMPRPKRAELECREQVTRWVPGQFYERWLETYFPREYDTLWFGTGGSLTLHGRNVEWQAILEAKARALAER